MAEHPPQWRQFEELVARIQTELSPQATVRHNDHIDGKLSGKKRQIDVSIRQSVGPHELLLIVDCKDLKRPANVKDIEEVIGLARDVGANKAAVVSSSGFTQAARRRGQQAGVDLLRLIDTAEHNWRSFVTIPVVVRFTRLSSYNFRLHSLEAKPWAVPNIDPRLIEVVSAEGKPLGRLGDLLAAAWNEGRLPMTPAEHADIPLVENGYLAGPAGPVATALTTTIRVTETLYFGDLPVDEISGFSNETTGTLTTRGFTTAAIDILDVQQNWAVIENVDALAVKPLMRLEASNYIPALRETSAK